jgi:exodeoxyribonuclease VII small subunit
MVTPEDKNSSQNLSFEEALIELEDIVKKLEGGNLPLESAIELYSRGNFLKSYCEKKLSEAKLKVEQIVISQDSSISLNPMEIK